MALDVGVVQIDCSQTQPSGAAYQYAWGLMAYDDLEGDCWKASDGGQVFIELAYETMASHAMGYIETKGLSSIEAHQVMRWVIGLPWRGNVVMLHLGW